MPPIPTSTIILDTDVLINDIFTIQVKFQNTDTTAIGFKPFVDVLLPPGIVVNDIENSREQTVSASSKLIGEWDADNSQWLLNESQVTEHPFGDTLALPNSSTAGLRWYSLESHYSSYGPDQPNVDIATFNCTLSEDDGAVLGNQLNVQTIPGFRYGLDAEDNADTDPGIQGSVASSNVTPSLIRLTKTNLLPEAETATGVNFPFYFKIDVDVAPQKTVDNLVIQDEIPEAVTYIDNSETSSVSEDSFNLSSPSPDRTIRWTYNSITGTGSDDIVIQYQVYVPYRDYSGVLVLDNETGASRSITTNVTADYEYLETAYQATDDDTFIARSIAIQKSISSGDNPVIPESNLSYTHQIQISDYFSFENITIEDLVSDGHTQNQGFNLAVQTGQIDGSNQSNNKNVTIIANSNNDSTELDKMHIDDIIDSDTTRKNGERLFANLSTIIDDIMNDSYESVNTGINGRLYGGICQPGETVDTTITNSYNVGPTTMTLTYSSQVNTLYDNEDAGVQQIDINDYIDSNVTITGANYDFDNEVLFNNDMIDVSSTDTDIGSISLNKTVYAINSVIGSSDNIVADDIVTYRIKLTLSHQNVQDMTIKDFLPPPIIDVDDFTTFDNMLQSKDVDSTTPPSVNTFKYGPDHTYHLRKLPELSKNSTSNALIIDYGTYQSDTVNAEVIDLLYSVRVSDEPTADGLLMTNQATTSINCTKNRPLYLLDWTGIILDQPVVEITKSIVQTDNGDVSLSPSLPRAITFNALSHTGFTGTVTSNDIPNSDAQDVEGDDRLKYCITVQNTGSSTAYRTTIQDVIDASVTPDMSSIHITDHQGTEITGLTNSDLFTGLDLTELANDAIVVITYEADVSPIVETNSTFTNTVSVTDFANKTGGQQFHNQYLNSDTAQFTTQPIAITKKIISTSETHTSINNNQNQTREDATIGEEVDYQITVTFPRGTTSNFTLRDEVDSRTDSTSNCGQEVLSYDFTPSDHISSLALTSEPSYASNGRYRDYSFGDVVNTTDKNGSDIAQLVFNTTTRLTDYIHSVSGDVITTKAIGKYQDSASVSSSNVKINVKEPSVSITKSLHDTTLTMISNDANKPEKNDPIKYLIRVDSRSSDILPHNITVSDTFPADFTASSVTLSSSDGSTIPDGGVLNSSSNDFTYTIDTYPLDIFTDIIIEGVLNDYHSGDYIHNDANINYYSVEQNKPEARLYADTSRSSFQTLPTTNLSLANLTYDHGVIGDNKKGTIGDTLQATCTVNFPQGTSSVHQIVISPSIPLANITFDLSDITLTKTSGITWDNDHTASNDDTTSTLNSGDVTVTPVIVGDTIVLNVNRDLTTTEDQTLTTVLTFTLENTSTNVAGLQTTLDSTVHVRDSSNDQEISISPAGSAAYYVVEPDITMTHELVYLPLKPEDDYKYLVNVTVNDTTYSTNAHNVAWLEDINSQFNGSTATISTLPAGWTDNSVVDQLLSKISKLEVGDTYQFEITKYVASDANIDDVLQTDYKVTWTSQVDSNAIVQRNSANRNNSENDYQTTNTKTIKLEPSIDTYQFGLCFEDTLDFDFDYEDVVINARHHIYRSKYGIKTIILDYHMTARGAAYHHVYGVQIEGLSNQTGTWKVINSKDATSSDPDTAIKAYEELADNNLSSLVNDSVPVFIDTRTIFPPDTIRDPYSTNVHNRTAAQKTWESPCSGRVIIQFTTPFLTGNLKILPYIDICGWNAASVTTSSNKHFRITTGDTVDYVGNTYFGYPRVITTLVDFHHGRDRAHVISDYYPDLVTYIQEGHDYTDLKSMISDLLAGGGMD